MTRAARLPHEGPLPGAHGIGEAGSTTTGPGVRISLVVGTDGRIARAAFESFGVEAARALAESLCTALIGLSAVEAAHVSTAQVAALGGLPPTSTLARLVHFAKSGALRPFLGRRARHGPGVTCTCFGIEASAIVATIRRHGLRTVEQVKQHLPASRGCGTCRPEIQRLLDDERQA